MDPDKINQLSLKVPSPTPLTKLDTVSDAIALLDFARATDANLYKLLDEMDPLIKVLANNILPDAVQKVLQRMLMGFTIARLSSVLQLTKCHRKSSTFNLTEVEEAAVTEMTNNYIQGVRAAARSNSDSKVYLKWAIKALMRSMHPMLDADVNTENIESLQQGEIQDIESTIKDVENRQDWLKRVTERKDLCAIRIT